MPSAATSNQIAVNKTAQRTIAGTPRPSETLIQNTNGFSTLLTWSPLRLVNEPTRKALSELHIEKLRTTRSSRARRIKNTQAIMRRLSWFKSQFHDELSIPSIVVSDSRPSWTAGSNRLHPSPNLFAASRFVMNMRLCGVQRRLIECPRSARIIVHDALESLYFISRNNQWIA